MILHEHSLDKRKFKSEIIEILTFWKWLAKFRTSNMNEVHSTKIIIYKKLQEEVITL